jgi:hypothetical protein
MQQVTVDEVLQLVYNWFREHGGEWPDFDTIERWLGKFRGLDAIQIVNSIPETLLTPLNYAGGRPDPKGKMVLSVEGVARCRGSDDDVHNFVAALRWMVQHDEDYDPPQGRAGGVPISAEELAEELRLPLISDSKSIRRLVALLNAEGLVSDDEYA